jgi:hypothetical protein
MESLVKMNAECVQWKAAKALAVYSDKQKLYVNEWLASACADYNRPSFFKWNFKPLTLEEFTQHVENLLSRHNSDEELSGDDALLVHQYRTALSYYSYEKDMLVRLLSILSDWILDNTIYLTLQDWSILAGID